MTKFLDRYPNEVSLGQRQRAALVRALVLQPAYLLMDEPTSALDAEQAGSILRQIKSLAEKNIGVLVVTHHLGFVRHADVIHFMEGGKILEPGGGEVIDSPSHPRLVQFMKVANAMRWSA